MWINRRYNSFFSIAAYAARKAVKQPNRACMAELLHIKGNSTVNRLRFLLKKSYNEGVKNDSIAVGMVRIKIVRGDERCMKLIR